MLIIILVFTYVLFEQLFLKLFTDGAYIFFKFLPELILYLYFIVILIRNFKQRILWRVTGIEVSLILFILISFISIYINDVNLYLGVLDLRTYTRFIVVFLILSQLDEVSDIGLLYKALMIFLVVNIPVGLSQLYDFYPIMSLVKPGEVVIDDKNFQQLTDLYDNQKFASGTLFRYGIFGSFMSLTFILSYQIYKVNNDKKWGFIASLSLLGVGVSFARKAWLVIFGYILASYGKVKADVRFIFFIIIFSFLSLFLSAGNLSVSSDEGSPYRVLDLVNMKYIEHALERTRGYILVNVSAAVFNESPLFGFGPGNVGSAYSGTSGGSNGLFESNIVNSEFYDERWKLLTDVGLVNIFAKTGILGLLVYLMMILTIYRKALAVSKSRNISIQQRSISYGLLYMIPAMIFFNLAGFAFSYRSTSMLFWIISGLVINSYMNSDSIRIKKLAI